MYQLDKIPFQESYRFVHRSPAGKNKIEKSHTS